MKRGFPSAMALAALVASAPQVQAQSFSPSSGSVSGTGALTIKTSLAVSCSVSLTATPVTSTSAAIPTKTLHPGSAICGAFAVPYGPWSIAVVPGSLTTIEITIGATVLDSCHGTIVVPWSSGVISLSHTLPGVGTSPPCTINGSINMHGLQIVP